MDNGGEEGNELTTTIRCWTEWVGTMEAELLWLKEVIHSETITLMRVDDLYLIASTWPSPFLGKPLNEEAIDV